MIELRYNTDGKLEYRTAITVGQYRGLYANFDAGELQWDEWKIVPSEQQSSAKKETAAPVDNNLRTERVTLEIVYDPQFWHDPSTWAWSAVLKGRTKTVRVVDETAEAKWLSDAWDSARQAYEDWLARVTRERDAARAENALLWEAIGLATTAVPSLVIAADDPVGMMRRVVARVAELEAAVAAPSWPRGWLTAEERDSVDHAADIIEDMEDDDGNSLKPKADALRAILARSSPPRVKVPMAGSTFHWIAAIREAGGEVEG